MRRGCNCIKRGHMKTCPTKWKSCRISHERNLDSVGQTEYPTVRNRNPVLNMSDKTSDTRSTFARDRNSTEVRML